MPTSGPDLILGAAQFGDGYGVTNAIGRLNDDSISRILTGASLSGIRVIDSAPSYADAEQRLGILSSGRFEFVTKFTVKEEWLRDPIGHVRISLETLNRPSLHGLLVHNSADFASVDAARLAAAIDRIKEAGLVSHFGVSVYDETELRGWLDVLPEIDILQIPGNLFDRRLLDSALVQSLSEGGAQIHARSAFLQGALLADPDQLPAHLDGLAEEIARLESACRERGVTRSVAALSAVRFHPVVDSVIVGAISEAQVAALMGAWSSADPEWGDYRAYLPEELIDPRRWNAA
jgi:aryl-alcohol dehydrogenase-like predicted oxidoreductase